MQKEGVWTDKSEESYKDRKANQSIIAGTAGYDFEPYAEYWKKYKSTILNRGDMKKINPDAKEGMVFSITLLVHRFVRERS